MIALDCRGHGASSKPRDADAYGPAAMSDDVVRVLDHCGLAAADVLGYSMGGRLAMQLLVDCPDRFDRAVLAGVGERALAETRYSGHIADALEADDPSELEDATARDFRAFAEGRDNDLAALAACRRAPQPGLELDGEALRTISSPVLVVAGAADELVGEPGPLADAIPGAEATAIPGCDHLSTVGDTRFRDDVLEFLARP